MERMSRAVSDLPTSSWRSLSFSMSFAWLTQLRSLYIVCESLPRGQNMPKTAPFSRFTMQHDDIIKELIYRPSQQSQWLSQNGEVEHAQLTRVEILQISKRIGVVLVINALKLAALVDIICSSRNPQGSLSWTCSELVGFHSWWS